MNSNWSYSPETPNLGQNQRFFLAVWLQFYVWPWKTIEHLFYATSSFVHHFIAIGEFKLELQSGNAQSGSNLTILEPCDLEIWRMTLKNNRATLISCIISSSYVNSNWSYSPETVKLGCDLCYLDFWPMTLTLCMDLTLVIGNNSWKFHDDTMRAT